MAGAVETTTAAPPPDLAVAQARTEAVPEREANEAERQAEAAQNFGIGAVVNAQA